jgi:hypothetical protein
MLAGLTVVPCIAAPESGDVMATVGDVFIVAETRPTEAHPADVMPFI